MRNIIFAVVCSTFLLITSEAWASAFCEGWNDGYVAGYCYKKYSCFQPFVPFCPFPNFGEDSYMDGYNRAFLAGLNARQ